MSENENIINEAPKQKPVPDENFDWTVSGKKFDSYSDEALHDPEIRAMAAKVDYKYHEDWQRGTETWAVVHMDTAKGSFEKTVKSPFGTPANPMDEAAFEAKFDSCAAKAACGTNQAQLDGIKRCVRRLETLPDIRELTALL